MATNDDAPKAGPNYPKIIGASLVVAAVAGGGAFAAHAGPLGSGVAGLVGFGAVLAGMLSSHAVEDGKKGISASQVKKKTEDAWNAQALGQNDKAATLLLDALKAAEPLGQDNLLVLSTTHSLANLYRLQRKYAEAETYFARATALYEKLGISDNNSAQAFRDRSQCQIALGKHQEALTSLAKALPFFEKKEDKELVSALNLQGNAYSAIGDKEKAIAVYQRVQALQEKLDGNQGAKTLLTSFTVARFFREQKKLPESFEALKELLSRLSKAEKPQKKLEAEVLIEMADVCLEMGQLKNVEPVLIGGLKLLQQYVGPKDDLLQRIFKDYKEAREKLNVGLQLDDFLYLFSLDREKVRSTFAENPTYVTLKDKTGWGPLQWCCFLGRDDLIKWLLRNGAKAEGDDTANVMGPIHVAAAWGKMGQVTAMLDGGATIDSVGPQGWTPLLYAAAMGKNDTVEQLLVRGAKIDVKDAQGRSALHLAAEGGSVESVAALLGKGADKNQRDDKLGRTPLHYAAAGGHGSTVEVLINNSADLFIKDNSGKTAAELAEQGGHDLLVKAIQFQEKMARGEING